MLGSKADLVAAALLVQGQADNAVNLNMFFSSTVIIGYNHYCLVLSPTTYLVNLLDFFTEVPNKRIYAKLMRRWADITNLDFFYINTNIKVLGSYLGAGVNIYGLELPLYSRSVKASHLLTV